MYDDPYEWQTYSNAHRAFVEKHNCVITRYIIVLIIRASTKYENVALKASVFGATGN